LSFLPYYVPLDSIHDVFGHFEFLLLSTRLLGLLVPSLKRSDASGCFQLLVCQNKVGPRLGQLYSLVVVFKRVILCMLGQLQSSNDRLPSRLDLADHFLLKEARAYCKNRALLTGETQKDKA
jgi:hypothetical protein